MHRSGNVRKRRAQYSAAIFLIASCCISASVCANEFALPQNILELIKTRYGSAGEGRVRAWQRLINSRKQSVDASDAVKLQEINDFFNQVRWLTDLEHWGEEDYWATPIETLGSFGGDCEDFSVGKYFSLLETDFENDKLRITYVKSLTYNQAHMVLTYYKTPDAEPLILDNINGSILPASKREDLLPIYSFSGESIWLAREKEARAKGSDMKSLPKWRDLIRRVRTQLGRDS